jgi:carbonic anhydrase
MILKKIKSFLDLKDSQKPHTFYIGCSDSRVVPNLITKTMPGEILKKYVF